MSLLKKVNDTFSKASETGKNAATILQLKNDIRKLEKELEAFYTNLGKAYEAKDQDQLEALMVEVKACKGQIVLKEQEIKDLEPKKTVCDSCGKELAPNAKFCGACGAKAIKVSPKVICTECGQANDKDLKFCVSCGAGLEEEA